MVNVRVASARTPRESDLFLLGDRFRKLGDVRAVVLSLLNKQSVELLAECRDLGSQIGGLLLLGSGDFSMNQEAKVAVTTPSKVMPPTISAAAASLPMPVVG